MKRLPVFMITAVIAMFCCTTLQAKVYSKIIKVNENTGLTDCRIIHYALYEDHDDDNAQNDTLIWQGHATVGECMYSTLPPNGPDGPKDKQPKKPSSQATPIKKKMG